VHVRETDEGHLILIGPAVIVAQGPLDQRGWEAHA